MYCLGYEQVFSHMLKYSMIKACCACTDLRFKMTSNKNIYYNHFPLKCTNIRQKKTWDFFYIKLLTPFLACYLFRPFHHRLRRRTFDDRHGGSPGSYRDDNWRYFTDVWIGRSPISRSTFRVFLGIRLTRKTA